MSKQFGLPRGARIRKRRDFDKVYQQGVRLGSFPLRARALRRPQGESRLGIAISARLGPAVVRNGWKRAIREAFRLHRTKLGRSYDLVISQDWGSARDDARMIEDAFLKLADSLNSMAEAEEPN